MLKFAILLLEILYRSLHLRYLRSHALFQWSIDLCDLLKQRALVFETRYQLFLGFHLPNEGLIFLLETQNFLVLAIQLVEILNDTFILKGILLESLIFRLEFFG